MSPEAALLEAIDSVDRHGDVASRDSHDPRVAAIRGEMTMKHMIAWDGVGGRYYVTSTGRDFQKRARGTKEPARGQVVAFRKPIKPSR